MSELRIVIREAGHDWSGIMHGSSVDRAIAALSADPVTMTELAAAYARFEKPTPNRSFVANLSTGFCDEPHDAGIVVVDLIARVVAVDSTYSSPGPVGEVAYHNGHGTAGKRLSYHLSEDWLFVYDRFQWQAVVEQRRRERAARPECDARSVLYGRPLLEFVALETFAASARPEKIADGQTDVIKDIHAAWLLTPRDDLGGSSPREVALAQHDHLTWDLQDQAQRWSLLGECPPGLEESSFAFRLGGFGTHELVQYYGLVRELLWCCRERLACLGEARPAATGPEALTVGDFPASEVPRLESIRDAWLDTPDPELHGRTPRSVINRERARLPEAMFGHDAIIDPDCPCCRMLADMPGPTFWCLDGCNMDDDFAFDIRHRTREEWEAEQREWDEFDRRFDAKAAERRHRPESASDLETEGEDSVWSSSYSAHDAADQPLSIRLFGIGCRLSELIADLRNDDHSAQSSQARQTIDRLNRDFGNLCELLQRSEPSLAASLIEPVIDRFTESLTSVVSSRVDLAAKCESLTDNIAELLESLSPESNRDSNDGEHLF